MRRYTNQKRCQSEKKNEWLLEETARFLASKRKLEYNAVSIISESKSDIANIRWTNNRFYSPRRFHPPAQHTVPTHGNFRHIISKTHVFTERLVQPGLEIWFIIFLLCTRISLLQLAIVVVAHRTEIDAKRERARKKGNIFSFNIIPIHADRFIQKWFENYMFTFFRPSFNCELQFVTWQLRTCSIKWVSLFTPNVQMTVWIFRQ